ncbi:hypothetical protein SM11_chr1301 [Sinorhizobium meliloti SM11]|uniref:Uncharacterized protein n=1 Tax=Sinorhizobium meliloti (strain SM11) TaxID=707241 RepID=F7X5D8_SINMM|nr:hypothetical protein SM11_chr1301 [Sinorhizobium meliloti SM11]
MLKLSRTSPSFCSEKTIRLDMLVRGGSIESI